MWLDLSLVFLLKLWAWILFMIYSLVEWGWDHQYISEGPTNSCQMGMAFHHWFWAKYFGILVYQSSIFLHMQCQECNLSALKPWEFIITERNCNLVLNDWWRCHEEEGWERRRWCRHREECIATAALVDQTTNSSRSMEIGLCCCLTTPDTPENFNE